MQKPSSKRERPCPAERWQIGDQAARAKAKGRHGLAQYAARSGRKLSTARRYERVAQAFPAGRREYPGLSFSHFEAAAARPDRFDLLERASTGQWTVARLKAEIASIAPASCADPGVRQLTPAVLDPAIDYLDSLAAGSRGITPRFGDPVRDRLNRLARVASELVGAPS